MWEAIRANRRRSVLLVTGLAVILAAAGILGGGAVGGGPGALLGLAAAGVILAVQWGIYASTPESVVLHGFGAREISREESPRLWNVVEEMTIASGLGAPPRVYLIDDPAPNAFAFGRKPGNFSVAVTSGLLRRLNRDEIQGVIAHEVGHLKNGDVRFMTLAAVMLGSILIIADSLWRFMRVGTRSSRRSSSRGGGQAQLILLLVALVLAILAPFLARILYFSASRRREYLADASAAQFTRFPEGLASALEKISGSPLRISGENRAAAPLFIINPLEGMSGVSIFSTHPPAEERIRILRAMGGASYAAYEEAARRVRGAGILGGATLRGVGAQHAAPLPIRPAGGQGPVADRRETRAAGYVSVACACGMTMNVPGGFPESGIACVRCGGALKW
ncbi:MAG: M48 family metallopeptidase [Planctomycetota bacterium]